MLYSYVWRLDCRPAAFCRALCSTTARKPRLLKIKATILMEMSIPMQTLTGKKMERKKLWAFLYYKGVVKRIFPFTLFILMFCSCWPIVLLAYSVHFQWKNGRTRAAFQNFQESEIHPVHQVASRCRSSSRRFALTNGIIFYFFLLNRLVFIFIVLYSYSILSIVTLWCWFVVTGVRESAVLSFDFIMFVLLAGYVKPFQCIQPCRNISKLGLIEITSLDIIF